MKKDDDNEYNIALWIAVFGSYCIAILMLLE
jgi:hypothetical protein